ncbi:MAG TPA: hypothetical protein DIC60_09845 [Lachnospiraceae bacterium]|nr:hypothetical protein [Lachnospiraceae bacterium]
MKTRLIAIITLAMIGATFAGCAAGKTGTNLGRAIDGNGYVGDYFGPENTGLTDGDRTGYYGPYGTYGTDYNNGLLDNDSGYTTYMDNSYRQGSIQNDLGTANDKTYNAVTGD